VGSIRGHLARPFLWHSRLGLFQPLGPTTSPNKGDGVVAGRSTMDLPDPLRQRSLTARPRGDSTTSLVQAQDFERRAPDGAGAENHPVGGRNWKPSGLTMVVLVRRGDMSTRRHLSTTAMSSWSMTKTTGNPLGGWLISVRLRSASKRLARMWTRRTHVGEAEIGRASLSSVGTSK
jgi:hypothetical protein